MDESHSRKPAVKHIQPQSTSHVQLQKFKRPVRHGRDWCRRLWVRSHECVWTWRKSTELHVYLTQGLLGRYATNPATVESAECTRRSQPCEVPHSRLQQDTTKSQTTCTGNSSRNYPHFLPLTINQELLIQHQPMQKKQSRSSPAARKMPRGYSKRAMNLKPSAQP